MLHACRQCRHMRHHASASARIYEIVVVWRNTSIFRFVKWISSKCVLLYISLRRRSHCLCKERTYLCIWLCLFSAPLNLCIELTAWSCVRNLMNTCVISAFSMPLRKSDLEVSEFVASVQMYVVNLWLCYMCVAKYYVRLVLPLEKSSMNLLDVLRYG